MASIPSLDKELRKMRLDKYTPAAANEARTWIESTLGDKLSSSDLLEGLKDGVALCKLVNLAVPPPGVKFKQSAMPFVQMENISHFLRACQSAPLNLQQHDMFLTVDLYEQKDPAQVLQCLGAFSRAANAANPAKIPTAIGPKIKAGGMSPEHTGSRTPTASRDRGGSVTSNTSSAFGSSKPTFPHRTGDSNGGRQSPTRSPGKSPVSSWSKKEHEGATSPAWNIAQYGYMGGASQGNLGIDFGGRRQITSTGPPVPSLAEKERQRKAKEEQEAEEEHRRAAEVEAEEQQSRLEEERRWEEETQRARAEERRKADEEKRRWEEEERQWKLTEEKRRQEEQEAEARLEQERQRTRSRGDSRLKGQFLSQYQAEQDSGSPSSRVKELEKELELARQREAEYERERQERNRRSVTAEAPPAPRLRSRSRPRSGAPPPAISSPAPAPKPVSNSSREQSRQESWSQNEREVLQTKWNQHQRQMREPELQPERSHAPQSQQQTSPRPLPDPSFAPHVKSHNTGGRPLPDPATYTSPSVPQNRTDEYLASHTPPAHRSPQPTYSRELGATEERDSEDRRRAQGQSKTKAGGWASKSLLEREMEMERERQREWEEAQKETAAAARSNNGVDGIGGGIGGRWDVGQWSGYVGGDSQNNGAQGIGGGRRQIVGPRPLPGSNR